VHCIFLGRSGSFVFRKTLQDVSQVVSQAAFHEVHGARDEAREMALATVDVVDERVLSVELGQPEICDEIYDEDEIEAGETDDVRSRQTSHLQSRLNHLHKS
jgi:hypothetical protein